MALASLASPISHQVMQYYTPKTGSYKFFAVKMLRDVQFPFFLIESQLLNEITL